MPNRIVLAEDDDDLRMMLTRALTRRGWEVQAVPDGPDVLDAVRTTRPDVVLLDGRLPQMSGSEVCAALRADPSTSSLPIVMFSGDQPPDERPADGPDDYLLKPVALAELDATLTRLVDRSSAGER